MRWTLLLPVLLAVTSCGPGQMFEDPHDRYRRTERERRRVERRERERERELMTGMFPTVTVGMSYSELKELIAELNPPYTHNGREMKNVWVGNVAQYLDTATIAYRVRRGIDNPPATVMVTVQGDTVVGFSR